MNRTRGILENVVLVAIVLVLAQTFLEDLATVLSWAVQTRRILLIAGFVFDLFFTIEFVVRSYDAWRYRRLGTYIWYERGWIDFLASIPLLLLNSGPSLLAMIVGGVSIAGVGGMLNVLKVVKAIRVARVLRLLRVLKIFHRIKNTDSVMAQRHVAMISAMSVSVLVFVLLSIAVAASFVAIPSLETDYQERAIASFGYIIDQGLGAEGMEDALSAFALTEPAVLSVEQDGRLRYSRYTQEYVDRYYQESDYGYIEQGSLAIFFDLKPLNREQATANLRYFVVIVAMVLVFVFIYSPHFALTVTDPIHVMRRGMAEKNYNLEVRIPDEYREDDVYRLANDYNRVFLPMKDRENASDESEGSHLTLGDVADLFD